MTNTKEDKRTEHAVDKGNKLELLSYHVSTCIGKFFYKLGYNVAENPKKTILLVWIVVISCCFGFINFTQERDPLKLWVPENSQFLVNTKFIIKNFGEGVRTQHVLIVAEDDVLTPQVMQTLAIITEEFNNIKTTGEKGEELDFDRMCFKIPLIAAFTSSDDDDRRKRAIQSDFDDNFFEDGDESDSKNALKKILEPFMNFDMKQICAIIDTLPRGCLKNNILELWKTNAEKISSLTKAEIVAKLNRTEVSPETGHAAKFVQLLGGIEMDNEGKIIKARSLQTSWMLHINFSEVDSTKLGNMAGTEDWATFNTLAFEEKFLETMKRLKSELETEDIKIFYAAERSYGDISSKTMFQDIDKLFFGICLMMLYMMLVLSKFSWPEIRFGLTSAGLLNVGMAYVSGCGLSSIFFFYSPVHTSLFFIIMGLGVDDMFVIMSALRKINSGKEDLKLSEKIGKTLEKAGASITITSLTDIIAFLVGGTTVLPSLKSFCIFAAVCILMTYLYVVTFFVAVLVLDERRLANNRNGCFPCITHKENKLLWEPKLMSRFIHFIYSKLILNRAGKTCIILIAVALSAFSTERVFQLKQRFDLMWFIPSQTQYYHYAMSHRRFYPDHGYEAGVYLGPLNYTMELPKIVAMAERIQNQTNILTHISSWTDIFKEFVEEFYKIDISRDQLTDAQFKFYISRFMFSSMGGPFQANFKFDKKLICGQPASNVKISSISFNFHKFKDRDEYLPAKKIIERIIRDANFTTEPENVFLWGQVFGTWITDEIIDEEIFRNISLALFGVFICTAVMIVNLQVCLYIFVCVLLSLVSVGGFMQLWGMSLDIVTCITLQLSVGLCIDCAAHIGHTFLTVSEGDGNYRALQTVEIIGAAVWQGGGSTMLAVALLSFSDAYTYQCFFKVFTIVVIFGLFYGTFLLPVILSIFAPKPYDIMKAPSSRQENGDVELRLSILRKAEESELFRANDTNVNFNCDSNEMEKLNGSN